MHCLVGLGNPGPRYRWNRHNIGYLFLDYLGCGGSFTKGGGEYLEGKTILAEREVLLIKPTTFMNHSGRCVLDILEHRITPADGWSIVYDDASLAFGILRFRQMGSSGGHKGIASIIETLGSDKFYRLRMGIGPTAPGEDLTPFVLGDYTEKEKEILPAFFQRAREALITLFIHGVESIRNVIADLNKD